MRARSIWQDRLFDNQPSSVTVRRVKRAHHVGEFQILEVTPGGGFLLTEIVASGGSWEEALDAYERKRCGLEISFLDAEVTALVQAIDVVPSQDSPALKRVREKLRKLSDSFDALHAAKAGRAS